ncbi:MAG: hypothetical protein APR53_08235 [Methanoculleus sp. SDB]|nr:MAG: hypothetical protein APR53_08235 [Methanoculleus sp. SDB]
MNLLFAVAVIAAIAIAAVITALYLLRIEISGSLERCGTTTVTGTVRWGALAAEYRTEGAGIFRLLLFGHPVYRRIDTGGRKEEAALPGEKQPPGERGGLPSPDEALFLLRILKEPAMVLLRSLSVRDLLCDVRFGTGEACTTGLVFGYFWTMKGILSPLGQVRLHMDPDFSRPVCEGRLSVAIGIERPLLVLVAAGKLLAFPEVRAILWNRPGAAP